MISQLDHKHIIKYYDSFIENDDLIIVMEYASGGDLDKKMKDHFGYLRHSIPILTFQDIFLKKNFGITLFKYVRLGCQENNVNNIYINLGVTVFTSKTRVTQGYKTTKPIFGLWYCEPSEYSHLTFYR